MPGAIKRKKTSALGERKIRSNSGRIFCAIEKQARSQEDLFDDLDAPIIRVAGLDVPIPFSPPLENSSVPEAKDIVEAVTRLLGR
jgi:pyruvate/2-oxoglutarate/acetoin dehydrogenase E1 component